MRFKPLNVGRTSESKRPPPLPCDISPFFFFAGARAAAQARRGGRARASAHDSPYFDPFLRPIFISSWQVRELQRKLDAEGARVLQHKAAAKDAKVC